MGIDTNQIRQALLASNGQPCFDGDENGTRSTYWSDPARLLLVAAKVDQGAGFTMSYFSRATLTPPQSEGDREVYDVWDRSAPSSCRLPLDKAR